MTSAGSQGVEGELNDLSNGIPDEAVISLANSKSNDIVTKDEPPLRVSRESRRRAWETT